LDNHRLNIADGKEGWIAYAIDGKIFVKKIQDNKRKNLHLENGSFVFSSSNADYIEVEVQGAYEKLENKNAIDWFVEWFALEIPQSI
jgi:hypothetical protein